MRKVFSRLLLASTLALGISLASTIHDAKAAGNLEGGLYFSNSTGNQGEFYSFPAWSILSPDAQTNMMFKYKHSDILIYVDALQKIASLENIAREGSFDNASKDYYNGDIIGDFKDLTTGEIISTEVNADFAVIGIE